MLTMYHEENVYMYKVTYEKMKMKSLSLNDCLNLITSVAVSVGSGSFLRRNMWGWLLGLIFKGILGKSSRKVSKRAPADPFFQVCVFLDGTDLCNIGCTAAMPVEHLCLPRGIGRNSPVWAVWGHLETVSTCPLPSGSRQQRLPGHGTLCALLRVGHQEDQQQNQRQRWL